MLAAKSVTSLGTCAQVNVEEAAILQRGWNKASQHSQIQRMSVAPRIWTKTNSDFHLHRPVHKTHLDEILQVVPTSKTAN